MNPIAEEIASYYGSAPATNDIPNKKEQRILITAQS